METRKIKRIPIVMDLLYEESMTPEEVIGAINKLSEKVHDAQESLSLGKTLVEARFLSAGRVLIIENFSEKTKKVTSL